MEAWNAGPVNRESREPNMPLTVHGISDVRPQTSGVMYVNNDILMFS